MAWVKLTRKIGGTIYVNMDRFDKVETILDEDGEFTRITSILSENDDDLCNIDVADPIDSFMAMLMAHGK